MLFFCSSLATSFRPSPSYLHQQHHHCPLHHNLYNKSRRLSPVPFFARVSPKCSLTLGERKAAILTTLRGVIDPDLKQDIVTLGFVKELELEEDLGKSAENGGNGTDRERWHVRFMLELTTPACPVKEKFREDCERLLKDGLPWVASVEVIMGSRSMTGSSQGDGALDKVGSIIAVASCKGGVGKSTTAVNLAFALKGRGAQVGLMDADVYGPSLPTLVRVEDKGVQFNEGKLSPKIVGGVKMMSFGFVNEGSAVMRGPMIGNMVNQLVSTTDWGELDYLIVDMPPGTGDVQLTLTQVLKITAAVIVTTPQKLAFVDVVKGLDMFAKVNVPTAAVVENMSYFVAPESGVKHYLFGRGHEERLREMYGIEQSFSFPLDPELCENSDKGTPFVVERPDSETSKTFNALADTLVQEVAKIKFGTQNKALTISYSKETGDLIVDVDGAPTQKIWPANLRRQCRCALCIDEMTGAAKLNPRDVDENTKPTKLTQVGNYAIEIAWSDGHGSLYPYSRFVDAWKNTDETKAAAKEPTTANEKTSLPV
eukprot:Plantae.Rhodophyta-Hildenbrandia_rubra.ctg6581.p1 GENE.Plantae.Rhodophyta-Hildenbrandia_rubra.ctg6581~~Plantae.Rhodophyta-Hildenbrandia_rubra.ctg6581.p1  ORF type:complete len:540 (-),score=92.37 Plantae.Rhodophyta-Hildenbrandia_rubra.ctg6581:1920-3539(-)